MVDEEHCVFFLSHRPRGEIQHYPVFLFMKGTGKTSDFGVLMNLLFISFNFIVYGKESKFFEENAFWYLCMASK